MNPNILHKIETITNKNNKNYNNSKDWEESIGHASVTVLTKDLNVTKEKNKK